MDDKAWVAVSFQATEQKAPGPGSAVGGPSPGKRVGSGAVNQPRQPGWPLSPLSIRQLKERVINLRGKHKQIYNLVVKEVDPQVNWAALVDEKLVRPRLQLWAGGTPPSNGFHGPTSQRVTLLMVPNVGTSEKSTAQRCSAWPSVPQPKWWRLGTSRECSPALVVGAQAG